MAAYDVETDEGLPGIALILTGQLLRLVIFDGIRLSTMDAER